MRGKSTQKAANSDYHKGESQVAGKQADVASKYPSHATRVGEHSSHPPGFNGPMATALKKYNGGQVLVFVMGAFAEMSGDVSRIRGIIAHELVRTHVSYYDDDAKRTKGIHRQRTQKAWGHTAHRGWARLFLDRARDLITHGPTRLGANHGAAILTDEGDQYALFFLNHPPRKGGQSGRLALLLLLRSDPGGWGAKK